MHIQCTLSRTVTILLAERKTSKSPKWNDDVDFVVVLYMDRAGA